MFTLVAPTDSLERIYQDYSVFVQSPCLMENHHVEWKILAIMENHHVMLGYFPLLEGKNWFLSCNVLMSFSCISLLLASMENIPPCCKNRPVTRGFGILKPASAKSAPEPPIGMMMDSGWPPLSAGLDAAPHKKNMACCSVENGWRKEK